jgi:hypothetical protein
VTRSCWVLAVLIGSAAFALLDPVPASASPQVRYGIQDDAWLLYGRGRLASRLAVLDRLGVDVVRYTLRWDQIARRRPRDARNPRDRAYDWRTADPVLRGLRAWGVDAVLTVYGTPRWANGGRKPNWAPTSSAALARFVHAAARRYPWIRMWTIWNEPNQRRWLRPTSARVYVQRLLNPAYFELHRTVPGVRVAGGVTAPRASRGGVSPVAWIREMGLAGALLDAYAHHPYPLRPKVETPWNGGCRHCSTLTMAELERLLREVRRSFGAKRIWLTEYGYQTDPPDRLLGVSGALQARHVATSALRALMAHSVDMLIYFLVRDETAPQGWQSGFFTARGRAKPSYTAYRLPLVQTFRRGALTTVWGQIRPRSGAQPYRLRRLRAGRWVWLGGMRWTNDRGHFWATVPASPGSSLQAWSPRDGAYSLACRVR